MQFIHVEKVHWFQFTENPYYFVSHFQLYDNELNKTKLIELLKIGRPTSQQFRGGETSSCSVQIKQQSEIIQERTFCKVKLYLEETNNY